MSTEKNAPSKKQIIKTFKACFDHEEIENILDLIVSGFIESELADDKTHRVSVVLFAECIREMSRKIALIKI